MSVIRSSVKTNAPRRSAQPQPAAVVTGTSNSITPEADVSRRLRELRAEREMSLRALAERSGLNVNTLSLIENNKSSPSVGTLQQIAATVIEQYVLPRLADAFIAALDRRLSRSRPPIASSAGKETTQGNGGRGLMRRHRKRGGHNR
jgi:transcriptional regulator with XRE-family HTH domain